MTINDFKKAIEGVLKGWHDKFDNLTSRPTVAELSDITVDTPAFRSYGEVIDLSGKEYVVGRVIAADGSVKNLYQKTASFTTPSSSQGTYWTYENMLGISDANIVSYHIKAQSADGDSFYTDGALGTWLQVYFNDTSKRITMQVTGGNSFLSQPATLYIRYTKVSD